MLWIRGIADKIIDSHKNDKRFNLKLLFSTLSVNDGITDIFIVDELEMHQQIKFKNYSPFDLLASLLLLCY